MIIRTNVPRYKYLAPAPSAPPLPPPPPTVTMASAGGEEDDWLASFTGDADPWFDSDA